MKKHVSQIQKILQVCHMIQIPMALVITLTPMMMVMVGVMLMNKHVSVRNGIQDYLLTLLAVVIMTLVVVTVAELYSCQTMKATNTKFLE